MSIELVPLTPETYGRQAWKNGGGVSTTIASENLAGGNSSNWSSVLWQLSRTPIVEPGPFSDLTGFDRLQVVVKGRGLVLETPTGAIDVRSPFVPVAYDGGLAIVSYLEDGPVEVVNLIARRNARAITMQVLEKDLSLPVIEATHIIYAPLHDGSVSIDGAIYAIPADHAVRLEGACAMAGIAGPLLLASISRKNKV